MSKTNEQLLAMVQAKNNMTFGQIRNEWVSENISNTLPKDVANSHNKGWCGNVIQELVFNIPSNSRSEADFEEKYDADLELKVTPVKKINDGSYSPKERLVLGMMDYNKMSDNFSTSHVLSKSRNMLITIYEYKKAIEKDKYKVLQSLIWDYDKIPELDRKQIEKDYAIVKRKVDIGKAEKIHGSDTVILEPLRKGVGKGKDLRSQPNSDVLAPSRGWGLKQAYLKKLYNDAISGVNTNFTEFLQEQSEKIVTYFNSIKGKDLIELSRINSNAKSKNSAAVKLLLKKWNPAIFEYIKDNEIKVRTMKLKPNGHIQESFLVSTGTIDENKIIEEKSFKDSMFYLDLNKPYVLATIKQVGNRSYINQAKFVDTFIADNQMMKNAELVWKKAKEYFTLLKKDPSKWQDNEDLLVKLKDKMQFHVRPHAMDGHVNYPGTNLTKQAFWINNTTLEELLK